MLKTIKRSMLTAVQGAGLLDRWAASSWRQTRLLILCYHGVSLADEHEWHSALYMSPAAFERRMALLEEGGYRVLPLAEALDKLGTGSLPPKSVAITFDDGAWDFYSQAHPILKKYGFPVTVYLTTYYCFDDRPVFNVFISYLLWKTAHRAIEPNERVGLERGADLSTPQGAHRAWLDVLGFASRNNLSAAAKDELARALAVELDLSYDALARQRMLHIMRPGEVSELAAAGVDFQLHTHRHRVPRRLDLFTREVEDNRRCILDLTGKPARHFCYPSGEYYREFFPWLRQLGVASATTCNAGIAAPGINPFEIPRLIDVNGLNEVEYQAWLSGLAAFLPRRKAPAYIPPDAVSYAG